MKLSFADIVPALEETHSRMREDGLEPGLVCHVGENTARIGNFFSEKFGCELLFLPSVKLIGQSTALRRFVHRSLPVLPEAVVFLLSLRYRKISRQAVRALPVVENLPEHLSSSERKTMLFADDTAYTGRTFEMWKKAFRQYTDSPIHTFSITVNGSYLPSYYCIKGWRSFRWRPVGL